MEGLRVLNLPKLGYLWKVRRIESAFMEFSRVEGLTPKP